MIDTEFFSSRLWPAKRKKDKAIVIAWKAYLDNLNSSSQDPSEAELVAWTNRNEELFIELLYVMSKAVGYDFDKTHLKRSIYSPRGHGDEEAVRQKIQQGMAKVLHGEQALLVGMDVSEEMIEKQNAFQTSMQEYLEGKRPVKVIVIKDDGDPSLRSR
ncbi:hypothetical protein IT157_01495 [bacterium]|nr:hypothetical protein [bacterium]